MMTHIGGPNSKIRQFLNSLFDPNVGRSSMSALYDVRSCLHKCTFPTGSVETCIIKWCTHEHAKGVDI